MIDCHGLIELTARQGLIQVCIISQSILWVHQIIYLNLPITVAETIIIQSLVVIILDLVIIPGPAIAIINPQDLPLEVIFLDLVTVLHQAPHILEVEVFLEVEHRQEVVSLGDNQKNILL